MLSCDLECLYGGRFLHWRWQQPAFDERGFSDCFSMRVGSFNGTDLLASTSTWNSCLGKQQHLCPFNTFLVGGDTAQVSDLKFRNDGKSVLWTATNNHIYWMHMERRRSVCTIIWDFFASEQFQIHSTMPWICKVWFLCKFFLYCVCNYVSWGVNSLASQSLTALSVKFSIWWINCLYDYEYKIVNLLSLILHFNGIHFK
jgi:hypothetical protein